MPFHASKYVKKQHAFDAEMRIKVDARIYPVEQQTEELIFELAQRVLEGENVEGVIVEKFEVRENDERDRMEEYEFASGFMRSAERVHETTDIEPSEEDS